MANTKGSANIRHMMQTGKNSLLPPKSPFPSMPPSYTDYDASTAVGSKAHLKPKDGNSFHQRTSSESFLMEEQPSWLDELLDEPETPMRRGHRRSSSDSFAYMDAASMSNVEYIPVSHDENKFKLKASAQVWGCQNFNHYKDAQTGSYFTDPKIFGKPNNIAWEQSLSSMACPGGIQSLSDTSIPQTLGLAIGPLGADLGLPKAAEKQDRADFGLNDPKFSSEKKDLSHVKSGASDNDSKRAKQQFAQRSRVRKLQYIAELERNVQALQTEGSEVSAELEFLNQQNLILSMENKALKQRVESLSQEQLIKYLEHEVLEREIGRLRTLYQQPQLQQPQQRQPISSHRRVNSRDLDSQLANLSLKHSEAGSGTDTVNGPVRT